MRGPRRGLVVVVLLVGAAASVAALRAALETETEPEPMVEAARVIERVPGPPPRATSTTVVATTTTATTPSTTTTTVAASSTTTTRVASTTTTTTAATTTTTSPRTSSSSSSSTSTTTGPTRWPLRGADGSLYVTVEVSDPSPGPGDEVVVTVTYEDHRGHLDDIAVDFGDRTEQKREDAAPRCSGPGAPVPTFERGTRSFAHRYAAAGPHVVTVRVVTDDCDGGTDQVRLRGRLSR